MEVPSFDPFQYKPNISASSRKLYTFNLMKLNGGKPLKDLKFLSKPEDILTNLEEVKPNTRRTYLIAIVSALKDRPEAKYKKLYNKFYEPLDKLNKSLKDNTEKTEKVKENWMDQSDINKQLEDLKKIYPEIKDKKKITQEEYQQLLKLVVLSLYTLQAPRRNKDYIDCLIVRKVPEDTTKNYLDITDWNWIFNNYKTQKKYKNQVIPVEPELKEILEVYLKFHPQAKEIAKKKCAVPFLPLNSSTDMTRMLNKILGKKVGCSMIRAIYLTNKFGKEQKDLQETATNMATSVGTIQNNYIKTD
jgi:integrase